MFLRKNLYDFKPLAEATDGNTLTIRNPIPYQGDQYRPADTAVMCLYLDAHPHIQVLNLDVNHICDDNENCAHHSVNDCSNLSYNTTLTKISLKQNGITDECAKELAYHPTLTSLNLSKNLLTDKGVKDLAKNTTLTYLNINSNYNITDELSHVDNTRCSKHLANNTILLGLELNNNNFNEGLAYFALNTTLQFLNATECNIGTFALYSLMTNTSIKKLLIDNLPQVDPEDYQALEYNNYIKHLSVQYATLDEPRMKILANNTSIITLNLSNNSLSPKSLSHFFKNTTLTELSLAYQPHLRDNDAATLVGHLTQLTYLDLTKNQLGTSFAQAVEKHNALTTLHVDNNLLGDEGMNHILANNSITQLSASRNQLTEAAVKNIEQNSTLRILTLFENQINNEGAKLIAKNQTITELNVGCNRLTDESCKSFGNNTTLKTLRIHRNAVTDQGVLDIVSEYSEDEKARVRRSEQNLTNLNLISTQVGETGAKGLKCNDKLKYVISGENFNINVPTIANTYNPHDCVNLSREAGIKTEPSSLLNLCLWNVKLMSLQIENWSHVAAQLPSEINEKIRAQKI